MPSTVAVTPAPRHLERLEMARPSQAKADLKNLEVASEWRQKVGAAVARTFQLAGLTMKEAAVLLDRDQGQVSRWVSGAERPQLDALFAVEQLREPLVIALASLTQTIDVTTTISIRRSA